MTEPGFDFRPETEERNDVPAVDLSAGFVPKQDSHESPEPAQPVPRHGTAHVDDIVEPEGKEIAPQPAPQDEWTVIDEEDVVQSHPHLAAEIVLLSSVIGDNSLCDLLANFVADCFCSLSHQSIFRAMLTLRSAGIVISLSTLQDQCTKAGEVDQAGAELPALSGVVPVLAVDRATFYRYIGIVKYQWLTRRLQWHLQTTMDSCARGCSPVELISTLQQVLAGLKSSYDAVNQPAPYQQQENNYTNAEAAAASKCFLGKFDA